MRSGRHPKSGSHHAVVTGLSTILLLSCAGSIALGSDNPLQDLKTGGRGAGIYAENGRVMRVYGPELGTGTSAKAAADAFIAEHADALGVTPDELFHHPVTDGYKVFDDLPVMYQPELGKTKFLAVYYDQIHDGVPVDGAHLILLARNEPDLGYPIVLASSSLVDLSEFNFPGRLANPGAPRSGYHVVAGPKPVIFVDRDRPAAHGHEAIAAYDMVIQHGNPGQPVTVGIDGTDHRDGTYDLRRVLVDVVTGDILFEESVIHAIDVYGNVSGWATPGLFPDWDTNPEVLTPMPAITAQILTGNASQTDLFGDFLIPHSGSSPITVRSRMVGPSLLGGVNDMQGGELLIDRNITPPGPADFEHNPGTAQYDTAEVNAMLHTAIIHSWVLAYEPAFPGTGRSFTANVNISSSCNAYYDGSSTNFYVQAGGCPNTAYSTVVYHEYGHKLVDDAAYAPTGDYHEGMADVVAAILPDDPHLAEDFFGPNTGPLRDSDNDRMHPCNGESHFCGQVLSGSVWHTRNALTITEPNDYLTIITSLVVASITIHTGDIDPGVTIDFLTLDDNDGDLRNGTPHYFEINEGFTRHGLPAPDLDLLFFNYPNGRPATIDSRGGTTFRVEVSSAGADPQPGTGTLHYNDGSGWQSVPMVVVGSNIYDAVFPALTCPSHVQYYVASDTTGGDVWTDPKGAPAYGVYSAPAAELIDVLLADNFENNNGWMVQYADLTSGVWQRDVPVQGGSGAPTTDFDGSGKCWLTDNKSYGDVDGGPTRLLSPKFNLDQADAYVEYAYWMYSYLGVPDYMEVSVSNDNGSTWYPVVTYGHKDKVWLTDGFLVSDYVQPNGQVQIRFSVKDNPDDSITEAAIDAFRITGLYCNLLELDVPPLTGGQQATLTAGNASPGETVYFIYSRSGRGIQYVPQLDITLDLKSPRLAGTGDADASGTAQLVVGVPNGASGRTVWFQAAVNQRRSNVVERTIN